MMGKRNWSGPTGEKNSWRSLLFLSRLLSVFGPYLDPISTNFTSFFREQKHFDYLQSELLPDLISGKKEKGIRFWSAVLIRRRGLSIVITLLETLENPSAWDLKVFATDLSSKSLKRAGSDLRQGENSIHPVSPENLTEGGVLLIGHSESLAGIQHPFRYVKPAIYQKEK